MEILRLINPVDVLQGLVVVATVAGLAHVLKLLAKCTQLSRDAMARTDWLRDEMDDAETTINLRIESLANRVTRLENAEKDRAARAVQKERERKKVRVLAAPKKPAT